MPQLAVPPVNPETRVLGGFARVGSPTIAGQRHPLGLPPGSVRALLCLIVVSFVAAQMARGIGVAVVWQESLMIMLAHYFTSRRMVPLSKDLRARLEESGEIDREANPLHLPKHSVRVLIIAAFAGLGAYLYRQGRLFEAQSLPLLVSVGAYLLGTLAKGVLSWLARNRQTVPPAWWIDLKAVVTIAIVLVTVGLRLGGMESVTGLEAARLEDFSLGLVLFYFGSR
ncbi:MAG TPA: hypothetical protein VG055_00650 [Planctomycetaceae bacterium]|nr:hypothetical protein [Planctomycetaceae bacterium]